MTHTAVAVLIVGSFYFLFCVSMDSSSSSSAPSSSASFSFSFAAPESVEVAAVAPNLDAIRKEWESVAKSLSLSTPALIATLSVDTLKKLASSTGLEVSSQAKKSELAAAICGKLQFGLHSDTKCRRQPF